MVPQGGATDVPFLKMSRQSISKIARKGCLCEVFKDGYQQMHLPFYRSLPQSRRLNRRDVPVDRLLRI